MRNQTIFRVILGGLGIIAMSAYAQTEVPHVFEAGQPAKADEVNENFSALEQGVQYLESERDAQGASNSATHFNVAFPVRFMGEDLYSCGQSYLFGCQAAESGTGTEFDSVTYITRSNSVRFEESGGSGLRLWAVPITVADFSQLRFVGEANLYGIRGMGRVLVDDCDNPSVALINSARNPRVARGPETLMNNSGLVFARVSNIPTPVDVTGNTYGVMNFIESESADPICTPGVSDRTGIWDQFPYMYAEDTNDTKFDGPYTYVGFTVGLIDKMNDLEQRIEALEAAAP